MLRAPFQELRMNAPNPGCSREDLGVQIAATPC